jgi:glycosyltransferase involved in cell wall biosynthesis
MRKLPIFLSVVFVVNNQADKISKILSDAAEKLEPLVSDYELIVVDNASTDRSAQEFKTLTSTEGLANVQVYALTKAVDMDTAFWVGLENALGDFIAVIDPLADDISFLPEMIEKAVLGAEVVFAKNALKPPQSISYTFANALFYLMYRLFAGIDLAQEAPQYRLLSRRVVNFILQHPKPAMTYRHLPATGGFSRVNLHYSAAPQATQRKTIGGNADRGSRLLVSTTRTPMRLVTTLSLFGAAANLVYSGYVVFVGFFKPDVAEGWVSMSLQQSGMFLLISLVLMVLGEYILNMASSASEGPPYYIGQEFTSARMTRQERLNVEIVQKLPLVPATTPSDA